MSYTIQSCSVLHFQLVKKYIREYELDDRSLKQEEFLVALYNEKLVGFGRIRELANCSELCSLGVVLTERLKGVGSRLTKALIQKTTRPLFLVSVIPAFFESLGFHVDEQYPPEIGQKLNYCTNSLPVAENYVVMKR